MAHTLDYASEGIAHLRIIDTLTLADLEDILAVMNRDKGGRSSPYLLCDLRQSPSIVPTQAVRRALRELEGTFRWQKVAILGADTVSRMAAKIALTALGRRKFARFFKSENDAWKWLKGEVKR
jgi:hypothetical protein